MVARIQLKDEHVIHSRFPPALHVEAHEKEEEGDEHRSAIESHDDAPIVFSLVENRCKKRSSRVSKENNEIVTVKNELPETTIVIKRTTKAPVKKPTFRVVRSDLCSPSGGTRRRFIAFCLSPPSKKKDDQYLYRLKYILLQLIILPSSWVTVDSVSLSNLSMSLLV